MQDYNDIMHVGKGIITIKSYSSLVPDPTSTPLQKGAHISPQICSNLNCV